MPVIEILGFLLTIIGVILASQQNPITWLISIASPMIYIFIFFKAKLYADVLLQFFFITLSIYGFYYWKTHTHLLNTTVRKINKTEIIFCSIFVIILSICFYFFLLNFTNTDVPFADGFLTTLSLLATWLTVKKIIENWWIWIVTDLLYMLLFFYKELYITSLLYFILSVLAFYGLLKWKRQILVV